jgi:hypothetical protein
VEELGGLAWLNFVAGFVSAPASIEKVALTKMAALRTMNALCDRPFMAMPLPD